MGSSIFENKLILIVRKKGPCLSEKDGQEEDDEKPTLFLEGNLQVFEHTRPGRNNNPPLL
jgi:hypothetical protein